ncbi:porin [Pararhodonellum marinum]|uniref:porin n=1 Tax=Pararhodonellum marinum TaxID=2755358 RepID=UPI00188F8A51|nr:porin [Pararhodonellum marinum]
MPLHFKYLLTLQFSLIFFAPAKSQSSHDTIPEEKVAVEKLKYKQQPGLALAASKIFFSDRRYSISGFGEASFVNYRGPKNTESGDLELYYTNLYRFATFFGYRITDKIIWNSELQIEYLHDGNNESKTEFLFEAFVDFLVHDSFKARVGYFPLPIGYVNNNDEPIMFYSVNRSEVERLITPTTWIEFGAMFYGTITEDLSYALGVSQGLNAAEYLSGSWIRQGRVITWGLPKTLSFTPQLNYSGIDNLNLSISGFFGNSGQEQTIIGNEGPQEVKAPVRIGTGYAKYEKGNWRFVTVGTYGALHETQEIAALTGTEQGIRQIMGDRTMGYLFELGHDLLSYFKKRKTASEGFLHNTGEFKLPVFVRYERLNTHLRLDDRLIPPTCPTCLPFPFALVQNNLRIWTLGLNFNTKENIVLKTNYQFRKNLNEGIFALEEGNRLEFGFGFIF